MPADVVTIELEANDPDDLPVPTSAVRWWVTSTGLSCLVRIQGKRGDVRTFVADQWGEEIAYGGPDDDPHTYDVADAYAVDAGA